MIAAGLVLPARRPAAGREETPRRLLGLTLLERSILAAAHAGASSILVLADPGDEAGLDATLASSAPLRRAGVRPDIASGSRAVGRAEFPPDGHVLIMERNVVFEAALLTDPRIHGLGPGESLLFVHRSAGGDFPHATPIKVQTGGGDERFAALGRRLPRGTGSFAGVAVCSPGFARELVAALLQDRTSLPIEELPGDGGVSLVDLGGRFAIPVTTRDAVRVARRKLLASVRKPTDGFVSRTCNRPLSLALSRLFIRLGATPNMISALGLALGLAGAWLVARGGYGGPLLGALLFQAASIVDGSDGEVAKLTYAASPHGSWIDTMCDQIASLAFFAALPVGAWRTTGNRAYLMLGVTTLLALAALFALMIRHVRRFGAHGSMVQILDDLRRASSAPGALGRTARLVTALSFTVRRDFFAMAFLVLALVDGLRAAVWTIGLAVPAAVLYLAWFSRRFAALR